MENLEGGGVNSPSPDEVSKEQPQMSQLATLGGIFFEPGRVFEDMRRKPRFIVAGVIIALLVTAYSFGLSYKIGEAGMRSYVAAQIERSPQGQAMDPQQKANAIDLQMKISSYGKFAVPVFVFASFFIGGLLYWLGSKAFGGDGGYLHGVSVWVYSGFPPAVVSMLLSFVVMAFKSADDIDIAASQRGLLQANPSFLVDGKASPVLATMLSTVDLFAIWGWILAAIGLRLTTKLSSGSAWAVTIIIALIGIVFRLIGAYFSGNPT